MGSSCRQSDWMLDTGALWCYLLELAALTGKMGTWELGLGGCRGTGGRGSPGETEEKRGREK